MTLSDYIHNKGINRDELSPETGKAERAEQRTVKTRREEDPYNRDKDKHVACIFYWCHFIWFRSDNCESKLYVLVE